MKNLIGGRLAIVAVAACAMTGCQWFAKGPLDRTVDQQLREQMAAQYRQYLDQVKESPDIEVTRPKSNVDAHIKEADREERRADWKKMGGPESYKDSPLKLGKDLTGKSDAPVLNMTLKRAIQLAVKNNLDVEQARIVPAITGAQVTQALAVFDALYFASLTHDVLDTQTPALVFMPPGTSPFTQTRTTSFQTGINKRTNTGASITLSAGINRNDRAPSPFVVGTYYDADILLSITQPLLRGFGVDVNEADIMLTKSSRDQSGEQLRQTLLDVALAVEQTYWRLVFARARLLIQTRLMEKHGEDVAIIKKRGDFDQSPPALMQAVSFAENVRAEVIRAQQEVRRASDALKRLVNSDDLPLSGETLINPLETPADLPVTYSLMDAVKTALQKRPEIKTALLQIKDASIRQRVADNARLPLLNVGAGIRYTGVDNTAGNEALGETFDGDFIDYLLSVEFEQPIGNRGPEALYEQRKLERRAAMVNYQNVVQQTVLEVKDALRGLIAAYELIGASTSARQAATENLRSYDVKQEIGQELSEAFMDQKLRSEQRLAAAEEQEMQALAQYNSAIATLYRAMGTLLDNNNVEVAESE